MNGRPSTATTQTTQTKASSNEWSFSTPEQTQATFAAMFSELKGMTQFTTSMYVMTYPEGLQLGYSCNRDSKGKTTYYWWNQTGFTLSTYLCDNAGHPLEPPLKSNTDKGDGTASNAGNNNTLSNGVNGYQGANLNYSTAQFAFTNTYLYDSVAYKSSYAFAINSVTGEKATFGNDWTLGFVSTQINEILKVFKYPVFAAAVECGTGYVLGTSSTAQLFNDTVIYSVREVDDPFFKDFTRLLDGSFTGVNVTVQLGSVSSVAEGQDRWFLDRNIAGSRWKLGINAHLFAGRKILLLVYMNIESVESQMDRLSTKTGYMMLGIIAAFVALTVLFSIVISRQLQVVVRRIQLLKDLKVSEMAEDVDGHAYSVVFELAELQKAFNSMTAVFTEFLKKNAAMTRKVVMHSEGVAQEVKPSSKKIVKSTDTE
ncbi:hypothetical protein BCR33DRAFT_777404 [Rhizoclosmatium globosum]|uniref:Uncharacterized protein n=1 Tax=Rhizoclosmatium globosum TaxID=329046 RepID=A0A1Y2AC17_9FUNG|nr:hypothetical protein BCR33DRAFT_777404 [Rhizoclosmatium globosum]|eukprot:ORY20041.1 hypothetical protein BCR33DRAFT_777404 [Rhizoclosmatium globosum]